MVKKSSKIIYDKESNALSLRLRAAKIADSDIQDNAVIDYDKQGNIVQITLYDFNFDAFKSNRQILKRFISRARMDLVTV